MLRVYFDSEFTGLHQKTTLISIGFIDENYNTFYAEFSDYDRTQLDDWLEDNVIKNLMFSDATPESYMDVEVHQFDSGADCSDTKCYGNTQYVTKKLIEWMNGLSSKYSGEQLEMCSDCMGYDWVLLNELWGGAMNKPECMYYIPQELCTVFSEHGIDPDINREEYAYGDNMPSDVAKHNALWDAKVIKDCWERPRNVR